MGDDELYDSDEELSNRIDELSGRVDELSEQVDDLGRRSYVAGYTLGTILAIVLSMV
jgi:hypothetical protein